MLVQTVLVAATSAVAKKHALRVESHVNAGLSFNMVSSLIIGSEAAVLIGRPLAIPEAKELAAWVQKTTDKLLVAVFTTHFHPDHYLSGGALLDIFPSAKYYANSRAIGHIKSEAPSQVARWQKTFGAEKIVSKTAIPTPYDFTFFTLPGDESTPIELLSALGGDTVDETLFWIPSIRTLVAGDTIYSHELHLWLADLQTPALTASWISSLHFIASLNPAKIVSGRALSCKGATAAQNLEFSQSTSISGSNISRQKALTTTRRIKLYPSLAAGSPGCWATLCRQPCSTLPLGSLGREGRDNSAALT